MPQHRHQEFIRFLNAVERTVLPGRMIHAILDNYATHKHPKVRTWLADHPRWVFHFTPTSASWLNAVEGFFSILTRRRLKRGVSSRSASCRKPSPLHPRAQQDPQTFRLDKTAKAILAKLDRLPVSSEWVSAVAEKKSSPSPTARFASIRRF